MNGQAFTSISVSAFADTAMEIRKTETGAHLLRIGDICGENVLVILQDEATLRNFYAALGEALKASEPHTMERAA